MTQTKRKAKGMTKREFMLYGASAVVAGAAMSISNGADAATNLAGAQISGGRALTGKPILRKAEYLDHSEIVAWLRELRGHPYVKQSGFDVTSVFKLVAGGETYYVGGVNVENSELTVGACGEEGAIATAITALGQDIDITEGWVMGAPRGEQTSDMACYPCGECRQRIAQYTAPEAAIHIVSLNGDIKDSTTRAALLPNAFSFRDLEHTQLAAAPALAAVAQESERLYREPLAPLSEQNILDWLAGLRSDARVSGHHLATVWRLRNGAYVAGVKIENAAYPSSTNVMSAAASIMNARYGEQQVEEVWLHGFFNESQQQQPAHDAMLSGASLQVLHQFARHNEITLHIVDHQRKVSHTTLARLLPNAPHFV